MPLIELSKSMNGSTASCFGFTQRSSVNGMLSSVGEGGSGSLKSLSRRSGSKFAIKLSA